MEIKKIAMKLLMTQCRSIISIFFRFSRDPPTPPTQTKKKKKPKKQPQQKSITDKILKETFRANHQGFLVLLHLRFDDGGRNSLHK